MFAAQATRGRRILTLATVVALFLTNLVFIADPARADPNTDLSITSTALAEVDVNRNVTITVRIRNNGPIASAGSTVETSLPPGFNLTSLQTNNGSASESGGIVTWSVATLTVNQIVWMRVRGQFDGTVVGDVQAVSTITSPNLNPANDSAVSDIHINAADLAMTTTISDTTPRVGDTVIVTLEITNTGPDPAVNVRTPGSVSNLTFVSGSTTHGTLSGQNVRIPSLATGDTATVDLTFTVRDRPGRDINSNKRVTTNTFDISGSSNNGPAGIIGTIENGDLDLDLAISSADNKTTSPVVLNVSVGNIGPNLSGSPVVVLDVPGDWAFSGLVNQTGPGFSYDAPTKTLTFGPIEYGAGVTHSVDLVFDPIPNTYAGQNVRVRGIVDAADQGDRGTGNNRASALIRFLGADISILLTNMWSDGIATSWFEYEIANSGRSNAVIDLDLELTEGWHDVVTIVAPTGTPTYPANDGYLTGLEVRRNQTRTVLVGVDLANPYVVEPFDNVLTASVVNVDVVDPDTSDNQVVTDVEVPKADLVTTVAAPAVVAPDETFEVTYTVTNTGPDASGYTKVGLGDLDDFNIIGTTSIDAGSLIPGGQLPDGDMTWNLPSGVPPGGSLQLTIELESKIDTGVGPFPGNSALWSFAIASDGTYPQSWDPSYVIGFGPGFFPVMNNYSTTDVSVTELDLEATVISPTTLDVGKTGLVTVTVINHGPDVASNSAANVDLSDLGDFTLGPVGTSQGAWAGGTWTIGTLASGASAVMTFGITPNAAAAAGTADVTVTSTTADQPDVDPSNNTDVASTYVPEASLTVTVVSVQNPAAPGDIFDVTVDIRNNGPDTAENMTASVDLSTLGGTVTTTAGTYDATSKTWSGFDLPPGTTETLTFTVVIVYEDNGKVYPMTAGASSTTYDTDTTDNTGGVSVEVPFLSPTLVCSAASGDTLNAATDEDTRLVVNDPLACFEYPASLAVIQLDDPSQNGGDVSAGSIIYHPPQNYNGLDTFEYTVSDGVTDFVVTVLVDVASVNDLPYLTNPIGGAEQPDFTIVASIGDTIPALNPTDVDGDKVTVTYAGALPGGVELTSDGVFLGTVEANGTYSTVVTLDDGSGGVTVYNMTIVVGQLPFTGLSAQLAIAVALLMIGLGATLVRRKRSLV